MKSEQRLPALVVSRGIGIGKIVCFHGHEKQVFRVDLNAGQIEGEIARFRVALGTSIQHLRALAGDGSISNRSVAGIFGVHILILQSSFAEKIESLIERERVNAEWAIRAVSDHHVEQQSTVPDLSFSDKQLDIEDVANRLLTALRASSSSSSQRTEFGSIIVARELSPSSIMEIVRTEPAGLITEQGGWTSHSSILAREFNLPMVSGVHHLQQIVSSSNLVIVDGIDGQVIVNPTEETITQYKGLYPSFENSDSHNIPKVDGGITSDGVSFLIRANIDQPDTYAAAKQKGANGIGLYRSESLISRSGIIPLEEDQFEAYCRIADAAGEKGVRIRTFDVGIEHLGTDPHWVERNPALGLRAIRLSLADPTHFCSQIRAILRASFNRKIDIILPMICGVDEIIRAQNMIETERSDLIESGADIGSPQLGVMIETPSAVLTADEIAKHVDFLCLGTNDLVQYLLAVDRDNEAVAEWYQTLHPAVVRAISEVLEIARNKVVPITICGEMAGSPFYVPVLLGLGARDFSMNANSIPSIRKLLSGISEKDTTALTGNIRSLITAEEIEDFLRDYYRKNWSDLFPPDFLNSRFR